MIDPDSGHTQTPPTKHHLFCSGHALLPDGRLVIMGGHGDEIKAIHLFDPATVTLEHHDDMPHGRWYPTVTVLPDGRAMVMSGSQKTGPIGAKNPVNGTIQLFDVSKPAGHRLSAEQPTPSPFSPHFPAGHQDIDLYPWDFVLPDGRVLVHSRNSTRFWHPGTPGHWDAKILPAQRQQSRTYPGQGTCVMLPLLPEENYRVRVMTIGGGGVDREVFYRAATTTTPRPTRSNCSTSAPPTRDGSPSPRCTTARPVRQRPAPRRRGASRRRQLDREVGRGRRPGACRPSSTTRRATRGPSSRRSTARICTTRPRCCCPTAA